jgi:hypothetical protein
MLTCLPRTRSRSLYVIPLLDKLPLPPVPVYPKNYAMVDGVSPTGFGNSAFADSTAAASAGSGRELTVLLDLEPDRHERLALPPDARQRLWVVLAALASFWLVVAWTVQGAWGSRRQRG